MIMNYREAQYIVEQGEPAPEEMCNIECFNCSGQWSSTPFSYYKLGDTHKTFYKHYIGKRNSELSLSTTGGVIELYTCPNCSKPKSPVYLHDIHSVGNRTPHDEYRLACLIVKEHELVQELKEVRKELRNYL